MARAGVAMLWVIACNEVTRHDARLSVQAGFRGREISERWPRSPNWTVDERPAGLFSHLFVARRVDAAAEPRTSSTSWTP
jgi:hypothetical protein